MFLIPAAAALTLQVTVTWPAPEGAEAVAVFGSQYVATSGLGGTTVFSTDGTSQVDNNTVGVALAGTPTALWIGGPEGLWHTAGLDVPTQVLAEPCRAVEPAGDSVLVADGAVRRVDVGGAVEETGIEVGGTPLLAMGETPAGAALGDDRIQVVGVWGVDTVQTGGPIGGFVWDGGRWRWSLVEDGAIEDEGGGRVAVLAEPGAIEVGDLDGDDLADLVVVHPGAVGVLRAAAADTELTWIGDVSTVAVGNLDFDGCDELAVLGGGFVSIVELECGAGVDLDSDGYTPAEGDCDDANVDTNPDATEVCNGRDDDCDGVVDAYTSGWLPAVHGIEGTPTYTAMNAPWCRSELTISMSASTDPPVTCTISDNSLACDPLDSGTGRLVLDVVDGAGNLHVESSLLDVDNAPPSLNDLPDVFDGIDLDVVVGDRVSGQFTADDVALDTTAWAIVNGPPGLTIGADGSFDWRVGAADAGDWEPRLVAWDEDGGQSEQPLRIHVGGCGGCSIGETPLMGAVAALLFWRRR